MKNPVINAAFCKGCGMCVDICPKKVFDQRYLGALPVAVRAGDCIACGRCELQCPDFAVTLAG